jgi:2-polyprenyl-3-methyl-5-hydroxy-6-metoxy-1,4-benzoquinol methylase
VLTADIVDLATEETLAFVGRHLQMLLDGPRSGLAKQPVGSNSEELPEQSNFVRLLEVGCGKGHLAAALARTGLRVRALDSSEEAIAAAKARGVDCAQADFLTYDHESFDILLFARSLHHINPVDSALEKAAALLEDDGLLLVEDFGADRANTAAIAWLGQKKLEALAAGLCGNTDRHREVMSGSLEKWQSYYYEKHRIADSQTMLKAAQKSFSQVRIETAPYMYRYLLDIVGNDAAGLAFIQGVLEEEKLLIAENKIAAVGWRLSCSKTG